MVTHNPTKTILNIYTSMPWPSLCAEVAKLNVQRRKGELVMLPVAANGDTTEPAVEPPALTTVRTTVQNTRKKDPKKLWDVRPLLKRVLVEAPGIEGAGNQGYSKESERITATVPHDQARKSAIEGVSDDSLTIAQIERAIVIATLEGRTALAETLAAILRRRERPGNVVRLRR